MPSLARPRGVDDVEGAETAKSRGDTVCICSLLLKAQLYTAIGVLGGIMAILVLTVLGGAYYIRSNRKHADYQHTAVPMDIIDVDGGRSMTKGQHTRIESHSVQHSTDSTPMLDTM